MANSGSCAKQLLKGKRMNFIKARTIHDNNNNNNTHFYPVIISQLQMSVYCTLKTVYKKQYHHNVDNPNWTKPNVTAVCNLTQMSALVVITIPPYKSTISGDR